MVIGCAVVMDFVRHFVSNFIIFIVWVVVVVVGSGRVLVDIRLVVVSKCFGVDYVEVVVLVGFFELGESKV